MFRIPATRLPDADAARLSGLHADVMGVVDYAGQVATGKRRWSTKPTPLFRRIKLILEGMCSGNIRCIYCEDSRADEIEHMQPKDLYPQKVFDWDNYVLACGPCNGPKNNRFAVLKTRKADLIDVTRKPGAPILPPTAGLPALINPRTENPLSFLWLDMNTWRFTPKLGISPRASSRAIYTIDVLRLNTRDELLRGRRSAYSGYLARVRDYVEHSKQWSAIKKRRFVEDFKAQSYRTVWLEMIRQRTFHAEVDQLLVDAPEVRFW